MSKPTKSFKVIIVGNSEVGKTSLTKTLQRIQNSTFDSNNFPISPPTVGIDYFPINVPIYVRTSSPLRFSDRLTKLSMENSEIDLASTLRANFVKEFVKLNIFDTAGSEKFTSLNRKTDSEVKQTARSSGLGMTANFFRDAKAVVFCFSLTNPTSLKRLTEWKNQCIHMPKNADDKNSNSVSENCIFEIVGTKLDAVSESITVFKEKKNECYFKMDKTEEETFPLFVEKKKTNPGGDKKWESTIWPFKFTEWENLEEEVLPVWNQLEYEDKEIRRLYFTSAKKGYGVSLFFQTLACSCYEQELLLSFPREHTKKTSREFCLEDRMCLTELEMKELESGKLMEKQNGRDEYSNFESRMGKNQKEDEGDTRATILLSKKSKNKSLCCET